MSNETYVYFDVYNHKNQLGTDSYALPFCKFKFVPKLASSQDSTILSNTKALWLFGDGSTSQSITATHAYDKPGIYHVYCYFYDVEGNTYLNKFTRSVVVKDYVDDRVSVSIPPIQALAGLTLSAGRITTPITVSRANSFRSYTDNVNYSIMPFASGSNLSTSYFQGASALLYSHLEKYHSFYTRELSENRIVEYVEAKTITTPSTKLYCKLGATNVMMTSSTDPDAFFCGTSGQKIVYFKDDVASEQINLFFGFEGLNFDYNTSTVGLSCVMLPNRDYNVLSVTSNGIDGEGTVDSTFAIDTNKFMGSKVAFVAKIKDAGWYTVKDVDITDASFDLIDTATNSSVDSDIVIDNMANGYIKGYFRSNAVVQNAILQAYVEIDGGSESLSGVSSEFSILDSNNTYAITKHGEDFDMHGSYKELGFQDLFTDQTVLLDDFLGSIVGGLSSNPNSIGKKVYEKITNFVDNNSNIEKCNIAQLVSLLESIGDENILFEKSNFNFPSRLKRLIDLLSIKHSKLFGGANNFELDFYNYGNSSINQGKNLGNKIDTLNYTISAGTSIVALEKFSNTFRLLDTYQPLSAITVQQTLSAHPSMLTYPLSTYSADWRWYLVLNDSFTPADINKYYSFFEYVPTASPTIHDSVINFTDVNNTIPPTLSSYAAWTEDNGIIDTIISNQLYSGLALL